MDDPKLVKVVLEVSLEELAYVSLALDYFCGPANGDPMSYGHDDAARRAQQRWDKLYKDLHRIKGLGVKEIRL